MYSISDKQRCWNERLRKQIFEQGFTQTSFADALNVKYSTNFTQRTISRWINLGGAARDAIKDFPEFKNMLYAAELLNVDIGYLLGETDAETFTLGAVCEYTGLSDKSIKVIQHITSHKSRFHFGYKSETFRSILNTFLQAKGFVSLVDAMHSLNDCILSDERLDEDLNIAFDETTLHQAYDVLTGTADYEHDTSLPQLPDDVVTAYNMVNTTQDNHYSLSYSKKIARYELNEAFILLINEIFGNNDNPIFYK